MIALLEAHRAGLLRRAHWLRNIVAGVVVGVVALPLAMAFAIASGAKPEQGLYTAIVAGLVVSMFGGSRLQIAGPTGAFIVILAGITAQYGIDGLQIATLLAGVMLLLLGVARLGAIIKFIPDPVISASRRASPSSSGPGSGRTSSVCPRCPASIFTKSCGNCCRSSRSCISRPRHLRCCLLVVIVHAARCPC